MISISENDVELLNNLCQNMVFQSIKQDKKNQIDEIKILNCFLFHKDQDYSIYEIRWLYSYIKAYCRECWSEIRRKEL